MSEEQKKSSFFQSLKNSIMNSDKSSEEDFPEKESVTKAMSVKSVSAFSEECVNEKFKGISKSDALDIRFAENFVNSGGKFIFSENLKEAFQYISSLKNENKWNHVFSPDHNMLSLMKESDFQKDDLNFLLDNSDAAISFCFSISADEGVIVLAPEDASNRRNVSFPKNHIIIAYKSQLKEQIEEAILGFKEKFDSRLPSVLELYEDKPVSRSNHKTLLNAEGPKNVFLFYIDSEIE